MNLHILSKLNSNSRPVSSKKWDSLSQLHTSIQQNRRSRPPMQNIINNPSLTSDITSVKIAYPTFNPSSSLLPISSKAKSLEPAHSLYTKQMSTLNIDELLMLEEELFAEKPHFKTQTKEAVKKVQNNPFNSILKGEKMNFTQIKRVLGKKARPKSNQSFAKYLKNPIFTNRRAFSVNKSNEKKRHDTPSPWGIEKSIETLNSRSKNIKSKENRYPYDIIKYQKHPKHFAVHDEYTST
ncbi:hypothetical protein SteCoe_23500 [Stentor coeruleus]|uniref:Uncharacterized protein n=1 Tax=Stentor coeruleus TaxID=5963 RepID=A0A1R2BJS7_9CILI|nr:hypothetical protein SteCoe_23500 [Stentor coeruleus]